MSKDLYGETELKLAIDAYVQNVMDPKARNRYLEALQTFKVNSDSMREYSKTLSKLKETSKAVPWTAR